MSLGELFFIGVVILLVVPPEKLPGLAREAARFWNDIRRSTSGVWDEIKKETGDPVKDIKKSLSIDMNIVNEFNKKQKEAEDYMKFIGSPDQHPKKDETVNTEVTNSVLVTTPVTPDSQPVTTQDNESRNKKPT